MLEPPLYAEFVHTLLLAVLLAQDNLPEDKEKATFVKMCSNCHAIERVVKVRFSKRFWTATVDDMVSRGAEGSEEEVDAVISYLTKHFGKPVNINTATAKELQEGLSFKPAEVEVVLKSRPIKSFEELAQLPGLNPKQLNEQKNNIKF